MLDASRACFLSTNLVLGRSSISHVRSAQHPSAKPKASTVGPYHNWDVTPVRSRGESKPKKKAKKKAKEKPGGLNEAIPLLLPSQILVQPHHVTMKMSLERLGYGAVAVVREDGTVMQYTHPNHKEGVPWALAFRGTCGRLGGSMVGSDTRHRQFQPLVQQYCEVQSMGGSGGRGGRVCRSVVLRGRKGRMGRRSKHRCSANNAVERCCMKANALDLLKMNGRVMQGCGVCRRIVSPVQAGVWCCPAYLWHVKADPWRPLQAVVWPLQVYL